MQDLLSDLNKTWILSLEGVNVIKEYFEPRYFLISNGKTKMYLVWDSVEGIISDEARANPEHITHLMAQDIWDKYGEQYEITLVRKEEYERNRNSNKLLENYLDKYFPNFQISTPLFYNLPIGIRFEIGNPDPRVSDEDYIKQVYYRATELFKETHTANDDIFVLLYFYINRKYSTQKKIKAFSHFTKDKQVLYSLSCKKIQFPDEEDEGWEAYRYVLKCKLSDIQYIKLLFSNHDIFFINATKNTIFHLYDSRGLDIVASSKEALFTVYKKYNEWILDYDRERIDKVFKCE